MTKETYLSELKKCYSGTEYFIVAKAYIESLEESIKELKELKKENTRLKKQLSKDHHIECSCSFCKPLDNQLKQDLEDCNDWQ